MQHGEAIVGHHGFGVVRSLLGEGCFSSNRPKACVVERTLGENVNLRGAVNASGLDFPDARRRGERHDERDEQSRLDGGSHGSSMPSHFLNQRVSCSVHQQNRWTRGACLKYQAHEALLPLMAVVV